MRLSDYVLLTFLVNIFSLAIAYFSIFKMANGNFKMAAKFKSGIFKGNENKLNRVRSLSNCYISK